MGSYSAESGARLLYSRRDDLEWRKYALTSKEVARILDSTPQEVNELARKGRLRGKRMGSRWRFRNLDVVAYLTEVGSNRQQTLRDEDHEHVPLEPFLKLIDQSEKDPAGQTKKA